MDNPSQEPNIEIIQEQIEDLPKDDKPRTNELEEESKEENIEIDSNNEKMNIYFKLKQKYNEDRINDIIDPVRSTNVSKKTKREQMTKIKPKCVNCKRRVGTIFNTKFNRETNIRQLIATCGSTESPCALNIELELNPVYLLPDLVRNTRAKMTELQNTVIKTKNDLLFGYINQDDAINKFDHLKTEMDNNNIQMETHLFNLLDITHNTDKEMKVKQLQQTFYINIKEYKQFLNLYEETGNMIHIKNANEYYINTIIPTLKELTDLKYSLKEITLNTYGDSIEEDKTIDKQDRPKMKNASYHLIQKPYTLDMLEDTNNKELVSVSHFKVGISSDPYSPIQRVSKKTATLKKNILKKKPRTTRKNKNAQPEE